MTDIRPDREEEAAGRREVLAASLDAAHEDLERFGPVSPDALRDALAQLEAEWVAAAPPARERRVRG